MKWTWTLPLLLFAALQLFAAPLFGEDDESEIEIEEAPEAEAEPEPEKKPERPRREEDPVRTPKFKPPTAAEINKAIDDGVAWLRTAQKKDGSWGFCVSSGTYNGPRSDNECYHIGPTAFAIFTLLKCDVPRKDKQIKKGLKWLEQHSHKPEQHTARFKSQRSITTYESSAMILMLTALNAPKKKDAVVKFSKSPTRPAGRFRKNEWNWMHEHVRHLIGGSDSNINPCQLKGGGWRYWRTSKDEDLSATQFCLLALREAARAGYPVHVAAPDCWGDALKLVRHRQRDDGSFNYQNGYPWSAGMGAAGIASLLICKEQLEWAGQHVPAGIDDAVRVGLDFLGKNWDVSKNLHGEDSTGKHATGYHYYHLYGIERVGDLSGKREIGGKAWYPRGAAYLLGQQKDGGRWEDASCMRPRDVLGTCFALLFLKRATIPVITTR